MRANRPFQPPRKQWWAGQDSNLRRRKPAELQSAPFGHSGTCPYTYITLKCWSLRSDSNRRPAVYKTAALPTELLRRRRSKDAIPNGERNYTTSDLGCQRSRKVINPLLSYCLSSIICAAVKTNSYKLHASVTSPVEIILGLDAVQK